MIFLPFNIKPIPHSCHPNAHTWTIAIIIVMFCMYVCMYVLYIYVVHSWLYVSTCNIVEKKSISGVTLIELFSLASFNSLIICRPERELGTFACAGVPPRPSERPLRLPAPLPGLPACVSALFLGTSSPFPSQHSDWLRNRNRSISTMSLLHE